MRSFPTSVLLPFAWVALSCPVVAYAQDAGPEDASTPSDAAGPDATASDETDERCLDGYDRDYIDACAGKQAGAECTFSAGASGQCASLRCLTPSGQPVLICVATTGMPAPPPRFLDAGLADPDASVPGGDSTRISGGGCAVGASFSWGSLVWPGLALLALSARRRR